MKTSLPSASGLESLSAMIINESKNLYPHKLNLTKDIERSDPLWRYNTRGGIMLSSGGVRDSLVKPQEIAQLMMGLESCNENFDEEEDIKKAFEDTALNSGFNTYRNDIKSATVFSSKQIIDFCEEDEIISPTSNKEDLSAIFCFGSHEGFSRLARCIYSEENKEMIYSVGGYGLLARAVSTTKPTPYNVHLAEIDRNNGEKILLEDLKRIATQNPNAKTLYLEAKTMCGGIYNEEELDEIIKFCKSRDIFLIYDTAHANMEFDPKNKFPDITAICQKYNHEKFATIITGSKTYGLERARLGFVVTGGEFGKKLSKEMVRDGSRTHGSYGDLSYEVAKKMMEKPVEQRRNFLNENREQNCFNMNLMIGYIEGINSPKIDERFREKIASQIPPECQNGLEGIKLVYKPDGGIQLKINMADLQNKYLTNIRMFNAEIFSYALQKMAGVSTLHSYQVMDPEGFGMRLSFAIEKDVHAGTRAIHGFVKTLTDEPTHNPFMPPNVLAEDLIFPSQAERERRVVVAKQEMVDPIKIVEVANQNMKKMIPKFMKYLPEESMNNAVKIIQKNWRKHLQRNKEKEDTSNHER